ncbi:MAG: YciI family protein [Devosia sp.]
MQFALVALDRPNAVEDRMKLRAEHLKYLEGLGDVLVFAGPFLNDKGEGVGSIVVVEAETVDAARVIFGRDPYAMGGLFDSIMIKPWKFVFNHSK